MTRLAIIAILLLIAGPAEATTPPQVYGGLAGAACPQTSPRTTQTAVTSQSADPPCCQAGQPCGQPLATDTIITGRRWNRT